MKNNTFKSIINAMPYCQSLYQNFSFKAWITANLTIKSYIPVDYFNSIFSLKNTRFYIFLFSIITCTIKFKVKFLIKPMSFKPKWCFMHITIWRWVRLEIINYFRKHLIGFRPLNPNLNITPPPNSYRLLRTIKLKTAHNCIVARHKWVLLSPF